MGSGEFDLDPTNVNVHGGPIALRLGIGASGVRAFSTLVHALQTSRLRDGIVALRVGDGMGVAMNSGFRIALTTLEALVAHARAADPAECCGVLLGRDHEITDAVPTRNLSDDPSRFFVDPKDHIDARREGRRRGLDVIGFYHSHPHSLAVPSDTDRAEMAYPDHLCVILGLTTDPEQVRAFQFEDGSFQEASLRSHD